MQVVLKTLYATPARIARAGITIEVPEPEARQLIEGRFAVPAVSPSRVKAAAAVPAETDPDAEKADKARKTKNR